MFDWSKKKEYRSFNQASDHCNTDETQDYWLIDFTYGTNIPKIGDTLVLNGNTYMNVLKTKRLDQQL